MNHHVPEYSHLLLLCDSLAHFKTLVEAFKVNSSALLYTLSLFSDRIIQQSHTSLNYVGGGGIARCGGDNGISF